MRNLIFYGSYYEAIKELPDEEQGKVYKAVINYAMTKIEPELSGLPKAIFVLIKPTIDASIKNYENGKKGGRPSKETQSKTETQTQTETQQEAQTITQGETETQTDIIFENENENKNKNKNDLENDIVEKENSLTRVKESEETSQHSHNDVPKKKSKHKFGEFQNVLLTDEEHSKLIAMEDGVAAIEYLSSYREMKGYKCKSDNLAIQKWVFDALKEERQRKTRLNGTQKQTTQKESPMEQLGRILGDLNE